ncbi:short chain dehydrogenase family protein [Aspergillus niger]|uniref:Short chain dehydrogenase family protein n=1 Tax=Aspergillus niger TaxID=5061 RepID=A0A505HN97_ASPNG|nr:short chain dehydrogenase family protein [Aspergillus niger]
MSLTTALQRVLNGAFRNLSESTRETLLLSLLPKSLAALLGYITLRQVNRALNAWSLNNLASRPWQNDQELVLVTGGCSGIGKAVMEELAQHGAKVIILDIQQPSFELPNEIRAVHGHPTVLVNNAGVLHFTPILDQTEAAVRQTFEVNTMAHYWTVKEFLPAMIERNHGHVVTLASMASFLSAGNMASYACSKASALAYHEAIGQELKVWYNADGVKTSVFHPLYVGTPMIKPLMKGGARFKRPVLAVETVSHAISQQILSGKSGQIIIPGKLWWLSLLRGFPTWLQESIRRSSSQGAKRLGDSGRA